MKLTKISSAIATGALFLSLATPSFAATNTIGGNGAFSFNAINWTKNMLLVAGQSNTAVIGNSVNSNANSGNNSSVFNVGGAGAVMTGPATNNTTLVNTAGPNTMTVNGCGCVQAAPSTNTIGGNGAFSFNAINGTSNSTTVATQTNTAVMSNSVNTNANSGNNSSAFNVGGAGGVNSGPATNNTAVVNTVVGNSMTVTP